MTAPTLVTPDVRARANLELRQFRERQRAAIQSPEGSAAPYAKYRTEPVLFAVERLGVSERTLIWGANGAAYDTHRWDGTPEPIAAMLEGLAAGRDVMVESGTGLGKSFALAIATYWFLACWENALVFTFAPKEDQLRDYVWKEMQILFPAFQRMYPAAEMTDLNLRVRGAGENAWRARGVSVGVRASELGGVATKASGMHAEHMLLIYEEAQGVNAAVIEAGENASTAPHNLRIAVGNPDSQLDALHRFGYDDRGLPRPNTTTVRISALDHPNLVCSDPHIVPGAASSGSVAKRLAKYGQAGRLYLTRVRGISPAESSEALIKLDWVRRAQARWEDTTDRAILEKVGGGAKSLGVDVANSEDGDEGCVSRWTGAVCTAVDAKPCPNANNLGFAVHLEMDREGIRPTHVGVDSVGVGVGTVNELIRMSKYVVQIEGGDQQGLSAEVCNNLRSRVYWTLAEDLRLDRIALPPDDELAMDLITPTYETRNSKIVVESKEDLKKRLGHSPNKGDSVAYGNHVRPRAAVVSKIPEAKGLSLEQQVYQTIHANDPGKKRAKHYYRTLRQ